MPEPQDDVLHAKLNLETARLPWSELQRFFAAGKVLAVDDSLDLVQVALAVARDDVKAVEQWVGEARLARVADQQAQAWVEAGAEVWTVVVSPWILVQADKARPTMH